ncbi:MAG TPA: thioredoxin family protein [Bacteroidota bacterium]|nr:thioredoxin family protein [Bacteroidota bacterium]
MTPNPLTITDVLPSFSGLPGVDGKTHSSNDFSGARVLVIAFTCNHCPYVQAYEERMIAFQRDYPAKSATLIAINSNETNNYPEDRFEEMVKRAREKKFNFPYLRDERQTVAESFGASHTPEFFVFDEERVLRYHGKMDDNYKNPNNVQVKYLRDAVDALLAGKPVATPETYSIGCTIKWSG